MGAALHHWDSKRSVYQSEVLAGVDVYQRKFEAGRVAWIGDYLGRMPKLWLVSDRELSAEDALAFSKEVLREVGINKAATYVRTDPHFWPPDSCSPYSLPLQWRQMVPPDVHEISRHTIVCKIDLLGKSDDCVMYRSK
jgi:hypothetical protein